MNMQLSPKQILDKAKSESYAIGAFNAANLETVKAIVQAAANLRSPVIIESSPGETEYMGAKNLVSLVKNYRKELQIPILINLDHAKSLEDTHEAINAGYDLIHIDASLLSSQENIQLTKQVVDEAHKHQLLVEGELNHIVGSSKSYDENINVDTSTFTDINEAIEYVKQTGIDTLAVFVGNVHGVYQNHPQLDLDRLHQIADNLDCFLSLHGGSGIPEDQIKAAIQAGIVKININTELRITFKQALMKSFQESDEVAIYKLTPPAIKAMQKIVEDKIKLFGSAGKA